MKFTLVGTLKQHKQRGCDMCKTKTSCCYTAPEDTKYCVCEWHAHPQYRYLVAEVKIRGQAILQDDFFPQEARVIYFCCRIVHYYG